MIVQLDSLIQRRNKAKENYESALSLRKEIDDYERKTMELLHEMSKYQNKTREEKKLENVQTQGAQDVDITVYMEKTLVSGLYRFELQKFKNDPEISHKLLVKNIDVNRSFLHKKSKNKYIFQLYFSLLKMSSDNFYSMFSQKMIHLANVPDEGHYASKMINIIVYASQDDVKYTLYRFHIVIKNGKLMLKVAGKKNMPKKQLERQINNENPTKKYIYDFCYALDDGDAQWTLVNAQRIKKYQSLKIVKREKMYGKNGIICRGFNWLFAELVRK